MSYPAAQPGGSFRSHTAVVYGPGARSVVATPAAVVSDDPAGRATAVPGVVVADSFAVVAGSPYGPTTVVGAAVVRSAATLTVMRVVAVAAVAVDAAAAALTVDDAAAGSTVGAEGPVTGFEGAPLEPHAASNITVATDVATTCPERTITLER